MSGVFIVAAIISAYLIGSIPFGVLVAKLKGVDIRQHGSKNIGATNVGRVLGRKFGIAVFVLDAMKGLIPTLVWGRLLRSEPGQPGPEYYGLWLLVALSCVLGHIFPIYIRMKGGKGVATALGATLGIYPVLTIPALICTGIWGLVILITGYVSLGSLAAAVAFPCVVLYVPQSITWQQHWPIVGYSMCLSVLVILRHRENIKRLLRGTESGGKSRP